MSVVTKAPRIIKSIRKKLFPLEIKKGPGVKDKFKKQDKEKEIRELRMGGSKYLRGGGIAQRGFGRAFMKGGRAR